MYDSTLEENGGQKYLVCFYDPDRRDWNQAIEAALNKHKLDNKTPVLCLPKKETSDGL